jgi:hypothetical protein
MIAQLAAILLPVFALAAIGYLWQRLGFPFEQEFITRLIMNIAGPCLTIDTLSRLTLPIGAFMSMLLSSALLVVVMGLLCFGVLRLLKLSVRAYLPALVLGNTGNMGLPLCLFAFGEQGLGLGIAVYVVNSVGQFTFTPLVQARGPALKTVLTTPVIYGAVIGVTMLATGTHLPAWLGRTVGMLGDLMIPLMLLALGNTLGSLHAHRLPFALGLSVIRLALAFAVTFLISESLDLSGVARGVLVLQGMMPAAVFNYLFAARYDREPEDIAGIVLVSTLLTAVLSPLIVSHVLRLAA